MGKKSIMRMLLTLSISQICYAFITVMLFGLGTFFLVETGFIFSPDVINQNVETVKNNALNGTLDEVSIPDYIEYAKLSESGDYVYGSIQDEELIKEVCEKGKVNKLRFMNGTTYELIGNSSEKWILGYKSATSQFSNDFLRNIFPSARKAHLGDIPACVHAPASYKARNKCTKHITFRFRNSRQFSLLLIK